jgi:hypothetical protein
MRWADHVSRIGQQRNEYTVLVRNPEGILFIRTRYKWEAIIKMGFKEVGVEVVD